MERGWRRNRRRKPLLEANLLIGDSLNHSDGDNIRESDDKSKDKGPNGHFSKSGVRMSLSISGKERNIRWPNFDTDDTESEHAQENDSIPPFGDYGKIRGGCKENG